MTVEVWKAIEGFEDSYEVSDQGRVRSKDRIIGGPHGDRRWKGKLLSPPVSGPGYRMATLRRRGSVRNVTVHTLVLEAFVGPRPEGLVCRHLDGDPLNNRLENLRWGTPEENSQDSIQHGTHHQTEREKVCPRGHRVEGANRLHVAKENWYICKACSRAAGWAKRNPEGDVDAEADAFYREVMAGTKRTTRRDECLRGHQLSGDNLKIYIRNGKESRCCIECSRIRARENHRRKKALK